MGVFTKLIIVGFFLASLNAYCDSPDFYPIARVTYSEYKDTFYVGDTIHVKIEGDANYKNECGKLLFDRDSYQISNYGWMVQNEEVFTNSSFDSNILLVDTTRFQLYKQTISTGQSRFSGILSKIEDKFYLEYSYILGPRDTGLCVTRFLESKNDLEFRLNLPPGKDNNSDLLHEAWTYHDDRGEKWKNNRVNGAMYSAGYVFYIKGR